MARPVEDTRWPVLAGSALLLALAADTLWIAVAHAASGAGATDAGLVLVALLPAIAVVASPRWRAATAALVLAGAGLGAIVFVRLFGTDLLDPGHTGWLAGGDLAQHYLGWEFFRRDAWRWPPGANGWLAHPVGTSLVYTDSMPLFGLLLKPFHAVLPAQFQYVGLVFFTAWLGQGAAAAWLGRVARLPWPAVLAVAVLACQSPALMLRSGHDTLAWQWLLLAGFALYLDCSRRGLARHAGWFALLAAASLVHPYLAAMLVLLFATFLLQARAALGPRDVRAWRQFAVGAAVVLAGWYLGGAFVLRSAGDLAGVQMGTYAANLLWPLDAAGMSRWLPELPLAGAGQWEGRAWPGVGGWLLLGMAIGVQAMAARRARGVHPHAACVEPLLPRPATGYLICLLALAAAFALSPRLTLGGAVLFDLSAWTPRLLEAFHASGRFNWLVAYGALALALAVLGRRPRLACATVLLAATLQTVDLRPWSLAHRSIGEAATPGAMASADWQALARGKSHLVAVPARSCGEPPADWAWLGRLALQHGLSSNSAYLARFDGDALRAACAVVDAELARGTWRHDTLYVFAGHSPTQRPRAQCQALDGVVACVAAE